MRFLSFLSLVAALFLLGVFAPALLHAALPSGSYRVAQLDEEVATADPTPIEAPVAKTKAKKKAPVKMKSALPAKKATARSAAGAAAPVSANDLMDAMRESLQPSEPSAGATVTAPAPAVIPPPAVPAPVVKVPAPAPRKDEVFIPASPEPTAKPTAKKEDASPTLPSVAPKAETPKVEAAKAVPEKPASGAPLLTEEDESPTLLGQGGPIAGAGKTESDSKPMKLAPTAKASAPAPMAGGPEFSKPRPLFSAPGAKKLKPGIERVAASVAPVIEQPKIPEGEAITPIIPPEETQKPATPSAPSVSVVSPPPVPEEPLAEATLPPIEGKTLFSQEAGKDSAPVLSKPDVKPAQSHEPAKEEIKQETKEEEKSEPPLNVPEDKEQKNADAGEGAPAVKPASLVPAASSAAKIVHASCGAANGVGATSQPTSNLCTQGTPSAVNGKGPWAWECRGENRGATVSCSAPLQVNGECGMASGSQSATAPMGQLCASGKASDVSGNGPWYWNCFGDHGGVVAQCVAYTLVSGTCGSAHNVAVSSIPASGLCASGTATAVLGEGPWNWTCVGSGEGTTVECAAPLRRDGVCGAASGVGAASKPVADLCVSGTASVVNGSGPWSWSCSGENGGGSTACNAPVLENASCGPAHGIGVSERPTEGLCASGVASAVLGNGPWDWSCAGEHGGASANCMAPRREDGQCGPAQQAGAAEKPADGLCLSGNPSEVSGSGPWTWSCRGANGGMSVNCLAEMLVHAACGAAHGVSTTSAPTSNLCMAGTPTSVIGAGPWLWTCQGTHGGSAANCMAPMQVNGACGAADATPIAGAPTANLCRSGTASGVSGNGPWSWTCQGAEGGVSATCQAPMLTVEEKKPETPVAPPAAAASASPVADVPQPTAQAGNECTPSVKRWTITCQQGGYPANYTGVIVGETQVLCPTGVERGVWLSNSCAPATNSAPVSPSPGKLVTPPPPKMPDVTDVLPPVMDKLPSDALEPPAKKLYTPRYRGGAAPTPRSESAAPSNSSVVFAPSSEGLDAEATRVLSDMAEGLRNDEKSIITLNAYAALPADGNQQEARRIALARALAARSYLMRKGLPSNRIDIRVSGPAGDGGSDDRVDMKVK